MARPEDVVPPTILYVHDDLEELIQRRLGPAPAPLAAARGLMALLGQQPRVAVLALAEQIDALAARGAHAPFAVTVGIAEAGERVARQVHGRTGWFPEVHRVEITRVEDGDDYRLDTGGTPLTHQLAPFAGAASLAVVDDTVFSGLTMRTVLDALPPGALARASAFCLRAVGESLPEVRTRCPMSAGFAAQGRLLEEVSFINASGLVQRGAIRRAGRPPLAFFERPAWIRAWFPHAADEVTTRCRALCDLLEEARA
ncbi:MAG: hypothetical protein HY294_09935 [Candidatus Rokubacteria bacterium]|nr:hypothetical protein [Candidatus Rokubacteria bacterium]MBI3826304.1 hypothetical protein [Candidatus Rokubacteria bacterium]